MKVPSGPNDAVHDIVVTLFPACLIANSDHPVLIIRMNELQPAELGRNGLPATIAVDELMDSAIRFGDPYHGSSRLDQRAVSLIGNPQLVELILSIDPRPPGQWP
ncbi:hypothetical protein [Bradyrhizobium sp. USDA 4486]